ncbi:hypothetical protein [Methylocella silvestris]|uniref:hypothetical protein n=1 Tax=Methylocella silvestris TaxID=199596 RepID=UPI0006742C1F|nr:hypothetical protein [Methylocella silvestris]
MPHDYSRPTAIFPDLSVDKLAADLRLQEKGMGRGQDNEPAPDSLTLDDVEAIIVERVETEKRSAHALYCDQLQTYAERMTGLDFEGRFNDIRQASPEAVSEFHAEVTKGRDKLFGLRRRIQETERDRDDFKADHKLKRSARVTTPVAKAVKIGVLFVLAAMEIVVNGIFLSKGSEEGLLGGAALALSFALINIFASFFLAFILIRQLNHRALLRKLGGILGLLIYVCFALALNLVLAHYREASGVVTEDIGVAVIARFKAAPFDLKDVNSFIFFCGGFFFSLLAMADGIIFRDPYPGYEAVERACIDAHDAYAKSRSDLIDELKDIRDDASEAMREAARDLNIRRGEYDSILQGRVRLSAAFVDFQAQLERTAQALLSIYREANRRARSAPEPARFNQTYPFTPIPATVDAPSETARDDLRKAIAKSQDILTEQVGAVHKAFATAIDAYRQIDDMIVEKDYGTRGAAA